MHDEEIYYARKPIGVNKSTSEGWNVIYKKAMRDNMHCWEMEADLYSCYFNFVIGWVSGKLEGRSVVIMGGEKEFWKSVEAAVDMYLKDKA